jgi:Fe2+ or Zn2+ uptake regulation protein
LYALQHARASAVCYRHGEIIALERETGATITDHHLVLNGICVNCRAATDAGGTGKAETARR